MLGANDRSSAAAASSSSSSRVSRSGTDSVVSLMDAWRKTMTAAAAASSSVRTAILDALLNIALDVDTAVAVTGESEAAVAHTRDATRRLFGFRQDLPFILFTDGTPAPTTALLCLGALFYQSGGSGDDGADVAAWLAANDLHVYRRLHAAALRVASDTDAYLFDTERVALSAAKMARCIAYLTAMARLWVVPVGRRHVDDDDASGGKAPTTLLAWLDPEWGSMRVERHARDVLAAAVRAITEGIMQVHTAKPLDSVVSPVSGLGTSTRSYWVPLAVEAARTVVDLAVCLQAQTGTGSIVDDHLGPTGQAALVRVFDLMGHAPGLLHEYESLGAIWWRLAPSPLVVAHGEVLGTQGGGFRWARLVRLCRFVLNPLAPRPVSIGHTAAAAGPLAALPLPVQQHRFMVLGLRLLTQLLDFESRWPDLTGPVLGSVPLRAVLAGLQLAIGQDEGNHLSHWLRLVRLIALDRAAEKKMMIASGGVALGARSAQCIRERDQDDADVFPALVNCVNDAVILGAVSREEARAELDLLFKHTSASTPTRRRPVIAATAPVLGQ